MPQPLTKARLASKYKNLRKGLDLQSRRLLEDIANDIRAGYERRIGKDTVSGQLLRGTYVSWTGAYEIQVGNRAEHSPYVEFGTGPAGEQPSARKAPPIEKAPYRRQKTGGRKGYGSGWTKTGWNSYKHRKYNRAPKLYSPPIYKWLTRKKGFKLKREGKMSKMAARLWASLRIAMKIKVEGTKPNPAFRKSIDEAKSKYPRMARSIMAVGPMMKR